MRPLEILLNLWFPPRCPFCGEIKEHDGICDHCQQTLPWVGETEPLGKGEFFQACYAPLKYDKQVVTSFHRYKFSGRCRYAKIYGELMAQSVEGRLEYAPDLITWAPISKSRRRRRGYDQSELLARELSRHLGVPLVGTLQKWRHTPPQHGLKDNDARKVNALGAYRMNPDVQIEGKRILLVDDIMTSGSTLSECARVLQTAGAQSVVCVTLAYANKRA